MTQRLGKLIKVDLRELWKNEEYDFSSWLAQLENLAELSDEIGIEIRLPEKEVAVGNYSLDNRQGDRFSQSVWAAGKKIQRGEVRRYSNVAAQAARCYSLTKRS